MDLVLTSIGAASALAAMALVFGAALSFCTRKFNVPEDNKAIITRIDALLPQTQCGQCGHPGCRPYAEGIASGEAINRCVPGGANTIHALAELTGRAFVPLDPAYGKEQEHKRVAYIREAECIGCTKCIQACPVDAIIGAAKLMHTVIVDECTGCDLCVEPCPVDCIDMLPVATTQQNWCWPLPDGTRSAGINPASINVRPGERISARNIA